MFDSEFENQVAYDSEEDQIIQYADSNAPINYKEMPTSVCDSNIYIYKNFNFIFKF